QPGGHRRHAAGGRGARLREERQGKGQGRSAEVASLRRDLWPAPSVITDEAMAAGASAAERLIDSAGAEAPHTSSFEARPPHRGVLESLRFQAVVRGGVLATCL